MLIGPTYLQYCAAEVAAHARCCHAGELSVDVGHVRALLEHSGPLRL